MTEPYTAADAQLVAAALHGAEGGGSSDNFEPEARAVLSALAEAGRLVPDGAGREWGIALTGENEGRTWVADDEQAARVSLCPGERVVWRLRGPWVEADEDTTR